MLVDMYASIVQAFLSDMSLKGLILWVFAGFLINGFWMISIISHFDGTDGCGCLLLPLAGLLGPLTFPLICLVPFSEFYRYQIKRAAEQERELQKEIHAAKIARLNTIANSGNWNQIRANWDVIRTAKISFASKDFSSANLVGLRVSELNFTNTNFTDAQLNNLHFTYCTLDGTNFSRANIRNANFTQVSKILNCNFSYADIRGIQYSNIPENCIWDNAIFDETTSFWEELEQLGAVPSEELIQKRKTELMQKALEQKDWNYVKNHIDELPSFSFKNVVLQVANLSEHDFSGRDFQSADLSYTNLVNTVFYDANLSNANLSYSRLNNADMTDATIEGCNFSYADIRGLTLSYEPQNIIAREAIFDESTDFTHVFRQYGAISFEEFTKREEKKRQEQELRRQQEQKLYEARIERERVALEQRAIMELAVQNPTVNPSDFTKFAITAMMEKLRERDLQQRREQEQARIAREENERRETEERWRRESEERARRLQEQFDREDRERAEREWQHHTSNEQKRQSIFATLQSAQARQQTVYLNSRYGSANGKIINLSLDSVGITDSEDNTFICSLLDITNISLLN